jgi:uncharacterized protein
MSMCPSARYTFGNSRRGLVFLVVSSLFALPTSSFAQRRRVVRGAVGFPEPQAQLLRLASRGNLGLLRDYIDQGALLSTTTLANETLLQRALKLEDERAFVTLLRAGSNASQIGEHDVTVIHDAAQVPTARWLEMLLENGADPNARDGRTTATPIFSALMADRVKQFKLLLALGADVHLANRTGNSPLHVAAQINQPWRALDLLRAGADPLAHNAQGASFQRYLFMTKESLLNAEARGGRQAVRAWLVENGITLEIAQRPTQ